MNLLDDLRWPWALPAVLGGALLVLLLVGWRARRGRTPIGQDDVLVAHTARLRRLPRYRTLVRRRRRGGLLLAAAAALVVVGTALVLVRPQAVAVDVRDARGRDLMLCLDASASMDADNVAVVREVRRIVAGLHGDRVGMVIWSGAAVQVFPLTDDTDFIDQQLDRAQAAFEGDADGFYAGVDLAVRRASVIGDGIVSCVNRLDQGASGRTRAVIVSSDNDPRGQAAYSLPQAATYAAERKVLLYGIGAASLGTPEREAARSELEDATAQTGGVFEILESDGGAERIVDRIDDLEKARASDPPRRVSSDRPRAGLVVSTVGVGLLCVVWLLRRREPR